MAESGPTPLQPFVFVSGHEEHSLLVKRDDLTESVAGGNKIRKLEFLLAEALERGADTVVSVGGTASNHCRAVAALCGRLRLGCALVLRRDAYYRRGETQGNLLLDNLFGAQTVLVERDEYVARGQASLTAELSRRLESEGKRPYVIPVGGSVTRGVWGYICMMEELAKQLPEGGVDVIFFASGSGGTAAGIAVGAHLCPAFRGTKVVGYCVCDTPEWFEQHVQHELDELGLEQRRAADLVEFRDAKGRGYSLSTPEEVQLIRSVARSSGIVLDGSYTGKAVFGFVRDAAEFRGKKCLFVHTGGSFSLFGMPAELVVDPTLIAEGFSK